MPVPFPEAAWAGRQEAASVHSPASRGRVTDLHG